MVISKGNPRKKSCRSYFCLGESPTYHNIGHYLQAQGWSRTRFKWRANFSEHNFQFSIPAAECLEFKHLLARLVAHYCPHVMPTTYCINDQNWPLVLNEVAERYYRPDNELIAQATSLAWILKPALLNNGQHIKIFQTIKQVEQHYLRANRLGGEHVLQQYLMQPHLLQGPQQGHKYNVRMFVVLTNYAGAYLYPQGYFNVALRPYQASFTDLRPHLTNEHLSECELNVVQIPTQQYELFKSLYPQIKTIIGATIEALQKEYPEAFIRERQQTMAIFGFDFIVDSESQVWLVEANHAPCFPTSEEHPLWKVLYYDFWQALITTFVLPIATRHPLSGTNFSLFESIGGALQQ